MIHPGIRRDLLIGGAIVGVGIGLLGFALFGDDDGFRAPRWVVATVALLFIGSGILPLRGAFSTGSLLPSGPYGNGIASAVLALLALGAAWLMVAVGPEGIALDFPLRLRPDVEAAVRSVFFYGLLGLFAIGCLVASLHAFGRALPSLGHTAVVAVVAPLLGLAAWVAIEFQREQAAPASGPVIYLSFDRRFPGDDYLTRTHGDEVAPRQGRFGNGLWVGGSGDWVEIDAPRGFDTRNGLTLELWMRRENWVNPYLKGRNLQTLAAVDLEGEYHGRPEIRQVSLSMEVTSTRPPSAERGLLPDAYRFKPIARVGEARVAPAGNVRVEPERWTHLAIVYDRFLVDRMRLYVDGSLVARSMAWSDTPGFADVRTVRLGTGAERIGAYRGMIDEVKVYARALGDDEIAAESAGRERHN
ncbi:MAG TPA: LamG domain-containing protein [Usitatibacter sp.]|nr:LamG domain-containing protein [Usitatibacter sp.]